MTTYNPLTEQQKQTISQFLESDQVAEGCLDFIAMHGFLSGIAAGPESLKEQSWLAFLFDGNPTYKSAEQQSEIEEIIRQQALYIQRSLYLDEDLELPCPLTAAPSGNSNQLSDWCFGFLEAISFDEQSWFDNDTLTDSIANQILSVGILSNQIDAPDLEHLTSDNNKLQQMANDLTENIQNIYLLFRD